MTQMILKPFRASDSECVRLCACARVSETAPSWDPLILGVAGSAFEPRLEFGGNPSFP